MKTTIYFRVAKHSGSRKNGGISVSASTKPNNQPLCGAKPYRGAQKFYPTVSFGVNMNIPDELFDQATRIIAELDVALNEALVSTEISLPKGITLKK